MQSEIKWGKKYRRRVEGKNQFIYIVSAVDDTRYVLQFHWKSGRAFPFIEFCDKFPLEIWVMPSSTYPHRVRYWIEMIKLLDCRADLSQHRQQMQHFHLRNVNLTKSKRNLCFAKREVDFTFTLWNSGFGWNEKLFHPQIFASFSCIHWIPQKKRCGNCAIFRFSMELNEERRNLKVYKCGNSFFFGKFENLKKIVAPSHRDAVENFLILYDKLSCGKVTDSKGGRWRNLRKFFDLVCRLLISSALSTSNTMKTKNFFFHISLIRKLQKLSWYVQSLMENFSRWSSCLRYEKLESFLCQLGAQRSEICSKYRFMKAT